ncbi:FMN-dependent NADH-azoreductase [Paenibacillus sp. SI8]|uniref:FMN-dependent NADH-azoreductase n=1 Tax=unclassified Paenibacillus TaxID=185978 RepID=UPI003467B456
MENRMLVINAHPKVESASSVSLNVLNHFKHVYKELNPNETIDQVNLYGEEIPSIDQTVLSALGKLANGEQLVEEEKRVTERMSEVLQQFKRANKYVIVMPLHNFNVPSKLKDYMDNILIARETFKYTENGSVGLLKDGRSVLVIQGSGAVYTNNDWYTEVEYSHKYLKSMFNFMGLEDYQLIRVQGSAVLDRDELLKKAYGEAEAAAAHLSTKYV